MAVTIQLACMTGTDHVMHTRTCLTLVLSPWPHSIPPWVTVTEPSAYTLTAALIGGGAQSNLHIIIVTVRKTCHTLTVAYSESYAPSELS